VDYDKMQDEVLRAFNDSCVISTRQQFRGRGFKPAADAFYEEATREIVVRFALPGLDRDDIELLSDRRELVVRGERRFPGGERRVYQQVEMDYGPFERRVRLMVDVDPESTVATYEAGVLEVRLTLVEADTRARKIEIATIEDET
jgi:HSP20 family protein